MGKRGLPTEPLRLSPAVMSRPPGAAPSNGKTVTRSLSDEQAERYRRLFDNAARLRDLAAELKTLAVQQAQADLDRSPS